MKKREEKRRETATEKHARQEKTARRMGLMTDEMFHAAGRGAGRKSRAAVLARRLSALGALLMALGATADGQGRRTERGEEAPASYCGPRPSEPPRAQCHRPSRPTWVCRKIYAPEGHWLGNAWVEECRR